jgi:hypothetical protein
MHCVVAWHIRAVGEQADEVREALRAVIKQRSWIRPLPQDFYIVKVRNSKERNILRKQLVAVARKNPGTVRLLVGPAIQGSYGGWLSRDTWPKIRKRTDEPVIEVSDD